MALKDQFSNRWGLILASLAMAIGAGNLWRFPRLAGQYGGSFILLWILFLLIWSIPILLAEFSMGKKYQSGVIGAFGKTLGKHYAWAGFFVTICTLGICFYYSVVTSWGLQYLAFSIKNAYLEITSQSSLNERVLNNPGYLENLWQSISNKNPVTVLLYVITTLVGSFLLVKGIQQGLEKVNKILIPSLFIILIIIMAVALNMENGYHGLNYMFTIDTSLFSDPKIWIEALSQSAWSTGAGWGLMLTISSYSRNNEDVTLNTFIGAFGNNTASLIAALAILPSVFALADTNEIAISYLQSGNQALTFSVIPSLFAKIPGGYILSILFFFTFFLAAFSSFLPMIELFIKNLSDLGFNRMNATIRATIFIIVFGFPSAWYLDVFVNQDWVWGLGLIVSGLLFILATLKGGAIKFKKQYIDADSDFRVPDYYFSLCMIFNAFLGVILIYWWMSQGYSTYPWFDAQGNWNILDVYSNASIVSQWGLVIIIGIIGNNYLYKKFVH